MQHYADSSFLLQLLSPDFATAASIAVHRRLGRPVYAFSTVCGILLIKLHRAASVSRGDGARDGPDQEMAAPPAEELYAALGEALHAADVGGQGAFFSDGGGGPVRETPGPAFFPGEIRNTTLSEAMFIKHDQVVREAEEVRLGALGGGTAGP